MGPERKRDACFVNDCAKKYEQWIYNVAVEQKCTSTFPLMICFKRRPKAFISPFVELLPCCYLSPITNPPTTSVSP